MTSVHGCHSSLNDPRISARYSPVSFKENYFMGFPTIHYVVMVTEQYYVDGGRYNTNSSMLYLFVLSLGFS